MPDDSPDNDGVTVGNSRGVVELVPFESRHFNSVLGEDNGFIFPQRVLAEHIHRRSQVFETFEGHDVRAKVQFNLAVSDLSSLDLD